MIKFVGFIIVLLSSCKIGFDVSKKYSERTKELRSVIQALEIVKNEIEFSNCLLYKALERASVVKNKKIADLMTKLSEYAKNGENIADKIKELTRKNELELSINSYDYEIINDLFLILGSSNVKTETDNIDNTVNRLKVSINNSVEDERKYCKLSKVSGLLVGVFIGIMFI